MVFFAVASPPENIEGKQTTFISSKDGAVTFGPNVTFGSKSVITTGGTTIIGGTVCGPETVKPVMDAGAGPASVRPKQVEHESQQNVVFAESANVPCKRAGSTVLYVGTGMSTITVFDKDGTFQEKIGSKGSEPGQFKRCPAPLCIDDKGKLYVGKQNGDKVQIGQ